MRPILELATAARTALGAAEARQAATARQAAVAAEQAVATATALEGARRLRTERQPALQDRRAQLRAAVQIEAGLVASRGSLVAATAAAETAAAAAQDAEGLAAEAEAARAAARRALQEAATVLHGLQVDPAERARSTAATDALREHRRAVPRRRRICTGGTRGHRRCFWRCRV